MLAVEDDSFLAILRDQDARTRASERAEFDLAIVSQRDLSLVLTGAVFYFTVGYRTDPAGTRTGFSEVRFRRLPQWTKREIASLVDTTEVDDLFG